MKEILYITLARPSPPCNAYICLQRPLSWMGERTNHEIFLEWFGPKPLEKKNVSGLTLQYKYHLWWFFYCKTFNKKKGDREREGRRRRERCNFIRKEITDFVTDCKQSVQKLWVIPRKSKIFCSTSRRLPMISCWIFLKILSVNANRYEYQIVEGGCGKKEW